jgi:hypothetical protein
MPNLNDFIYPKEKLARPELEKVIGEKPCSKCEENVQEAWWDPSNLEMSWTCKNGHENKHRFN